MAFQAYTPSLPATQSTTVGPTPTPNAGFTPYNASMPTTNSLTPPTPPVVTPSSFAQTQVDRSKNSLLGRATSAITSLFGNYSNTILKDSSQPLTKAMTDVNAENNRQGNPFSKGTDIAGAITKGVTNSIGGAFNAAVVKPAGDIIGSLPGMKTIATSKYSVASGLLDELDSATKTAVNLWNQFEQSNPNAAKKVADAGNIAQFMTLFLGDDPAVQEKATSVIDNSIKGATDTGIAVKNTVVDTANNVKNSVVQAVGDKANNFANNLEESSLRLTPTQKTNLGARLNDIVDYNTNNGITGSPAERLTKIDGKLDTYENKFQNFLQNDAKGVTVPKETVLANLEGLKSQYEGERDVIQIEKQIDEVKDLIKTRYPDDIPVDKLNTLKRSTFKNAYNNAGNKVLDTVEHDIGNVLYDNIEKGTNGMTIDGKDIREFNKEYSTAIKSRQLIKIASGRPELGFTGRLTSRFIGGMIGGTLGGGVPGEIVGSIVAPKIAESIAGTTAKTNLAGGIKSIFKK